MTLEEIFKDEPHLLGNEAVKKLIGYCQAEHKIGYEKFVELRNKNFKALDIAMHSEAMLITGEDAKTALHKIIEIL